MKNLLRKSKKQYALDGASSISSIAPVIVRDISGNISSWNHAAERSYGWSKAEALGNVSHHLLETVFPESLEEINNQLLESGTWKGELIHSLSDGTRVRVRSRWELVQDKNSGPAEIVEINHNFEKISPESAHFSEPPFLEKLYDLSRNKRTWLAVLLAIIVIVEIIIEFTNKSPSIPFF